MFDEQEFTDPWNGSFDMAMLAQAGTGEGQPVTFVPEGKWFKIIDAKGDSVLMAFVRGEYAEQTRHHKYLTVIIDEEGQEKTYKYGIGKLAHDDRELGVCGLANTVEVTNRSTLISAMHNAVRAEANGAEQTLTCGRFFEITPMKGEQHPSQTDILRNKQKALRDMEEAAKAAHSAGRSTLAQRFVQLVGPDVECAGSYLGKVAFPQQDQDGYWKLMVIYLGDHKSDMTHSRDFAACGEAVLAARRSIGFTKLNVPYRIIAFDRNFQIFLDSGVTQ
ncbi:MAG: hypothetical protein H7A02_03485 [Pseudomonadales bacterium]|nr:hypothetical protein [Pseudomonadales bacterium]